MILENTDVAFYTELNKISIAIPVPFEIGVPLKEGEDMEGSKLLPNGTGRYKPYRRWLAHFRLNITLDKINE